MSQVGTNVLPIRYFFLLSVRPLWFRRSNTFLRCVDESVYLLTAPGCHQYSEWWKVFCVISYPLVFGRSWLSQTGQMAFFWIGTIPCLFWNRKQPFYSLPGLPASASIHCEDLSSIHKLRHTKSPTNLVLRTAYPVRNYAVFQWKWRRVNTTCVIN